MNGVRDNDSSNRSFHFTSGPPLDEVTETPNNGGAP